MTTPHNLSFPEEIKSRRARLTEPHIKPLADLVQSFREELGPAHCIPDFDPKDGGICAEILFLLEAPGPKAKDFISRDNNDQTAHNLWQLNMKSGLDRKRTAIWNIVPYYIGNCVRTPPSHGGDSATGNNTPHGIGTSERIRAANRSDIKAGMPYLKRVLALLPRLKTIVLCGRAAQRAESMVTAPDVQIIKAWHPSPVCLNRMPNRRPELLSVLMTLAR